MNEDERRIHAMNSAIGWDDRKTLANLWQDYAPLPAEGLSDATYSALLAVARFGAGAMFDVREDYPT